MLDELNRALAGMTLADADQPAVKLARQYAEALDIGEPLKDIGPKLLAVLESLGMTPRSRAALTKEARGDEPAASPLDELRRRRAARRDDATAVDPAS